MRKHRHHDQAPHGGASSGACPATLEDLDEAVAKLAEAERLRAAAAVLLTRVRARGDGEAAVGMPVEQHLRWRTNLRRGTVSTLALLTDVAPDVPTLLSALDAGRVTLDQAAAVAWPAARVSRADRVALDGALEADDAWTRLSPELLEVEVARLLDEIADPARQAERQQARREQQYLHLQPTLDGQALKFWGQAVGLDAALLDATLHAAADAPVADDTPDPDGILVDDQRANGNRLFEGLHRILRAWHGHDSGTPEITLLAIVDERDDAASTMAELLTTTHGLAPRLTADQIVRVQAEQSVRRLEVHADLDGELVSIDGRAGHLHRDPRSLSEDTTRLLCLARDPHCRMPGCTNPARSADLHHLRWKSWGPDVPDDPSNRALVCRRCHHRIIHRWRWTGTVGALGRVAWHRPATGTSPPMTTSTTGRLARRLRPPPEPAGRILDPFGEPIPF